MSQTYLMHLFGKVKNTKMDEYLKHGGYEVLRSLGPDSRQSNLEQLFSSGLRRRTRDASELVSSWRESMVSDQVDRVVCDLGGGQAGLFWQREFVGHIPHQVIEAGAICAFLAGAAKLSFFFASDMGGLPREFESALDEAKGNLVLRSKKWGKGSELEVDFMIGPGRGLGATDSSLFSIYEGLRPRPRRFENELHGRSALIVSLEDALNVLAYFQDQGERLSSFGSEGDPGTRVLSVGGNVSSPGIYEISIGKKLTDVLTACGHDAKALVDTKAILPQGLWGKLLTPKEFAEFEIGSANCDGIIVLDKFQCMVSFLRESLLFFDRTCCGVCAPCRESLAWSRQIIDGLWSGRGRLQDIDLLEDIFRNMIGSSQCSLPDWAGRHGLSIIAAFREEFEFMVREGRSKVRRSSQNAQV